MVEQQYFKNGLEVYKIITDTFNSNTYIIKYKNDVLVVDPGENNNSNAVNWLKENNLKPNYCLITHEHFDHNIGYKKLVENFKVKTFCSEETKEALEKAKKNLSFFYNIPAEKEIENYTNNLPNYIKVYETPGHSKGSLCFLIDNCLFSGDTIIKKEYLVSKLPGGNKKDLQSSIEVINNLSKKINNLLIFPGHGDMFKFKIEVLQ